MLPHQSLVKKEVTHFLEPGHWFLSLYNDDGDAQEVSFEASVSEDMTQNCPGGCSGKGECLMGHCQCNAGFGGDDCSESKIFYHFYSPCVMESQRYKDEPSRGGGWERAVCVHVPP